MSMKNGAVPQKNNTHTGHSVEKARDFKGTVKKLTAYMNEYKLSLIMVFIFAVVSTVFVIVGPKILGQATTEIFNGIMSQFYGTGIGIDFNKIGQILLMLTILYVLSAVFSYIQSYIMTNITMKVTYNLRKDIMKKINLLPLNYFDTTNHGEILSRVTNDVDTLTQTLNQSLTQVITAVTTVIGILIMMFTISWEMTLVALCIVPISFLAMFLVVIKSQKHFKDQQDFLGHVDGHIEEMYSGHVVVQAFNRQEESIKTFNKDNDVLYTSAWKSQFLAGLMMPIMNSIANIGYVFICVLGGYLATQGMVTIGGIQAFIQYVRQFTQPILQISNISNIFQQAAASAERVFEFLEEENEIPEAENPITIVYDKNKANGRDKIYLDGNVEFKNVRFGYNPNKIIINDFSAFAKNGYKIAIVGPTGAGKSTVIKLLMRFYDVNSGEIKVSGRNIKDFRRDDLRGSFGMVLQETWLFSGTIMENLRYGRLDATDEEVIAAAKAAQVDHFVRTLPDGYNTVLDEEVSNISGGQKQLLTIARAILANPKMLILDEATSSVDTRTEGLISKAMDNMMQGRTSFVIAHRLSTITDADLILVMNNGDVIEQGNHKELLSKNGFYANLYNSQFVS